MSPGVVVAYTDGYWFVGTGVAAALVSAVVVLVGWHSLADYPVTYQAGDHPRSSTSGLSAYETWELGPAASVSTVLRVDSATDGETLSGDLRLDYGCPAETVDWRIYVADDLVASGTLREGEQRNLEGAAVQLAQPVVVRLTVDRTDSAGCATALLWQSPGIEGPGHGKFRFLFPLPQD